MADAFILKPDNARDRMRAAWEACCRFLELGRSVRVTLTEVKPTRTIEQNDKMWAVLSDIARQVKWLVNGELRCLDKEDWKEILSASLVKHQRLAQGTEGGVVLLGLRTSKMTIGQMSELIELAHAFGAQRGVRWGDEHKDAA